MNSIDTTTRRNITTGTNRFETDVPVPTTDEAAVVRAASILLGIELRGWLANREREYLDSLAPDNAISFLVHGSQYLHPKEVELFPLDLVRAAIRQGGDAVFSHRCRSGACDCPSACRVFTGMIGTALGQPLVLGMFGPDEPLDKKLLEDRFESVISTFRGARRSTQAVRDALRDTPAGSSHMLVNRASGRIIHIDPSLADNIDLEPAEFVTREYGSVENHLHRLFTHNKVRMENLTCGCLNLTCMTFTPIRSTARDDTVNHGFVDSVRGELVGMTSSAEYIESRGTELSDDEIRDLAARITRTGEHLDRRLARHQLLVNFDNLSPETANVNYALEHAIDRISAGGGTGITLDVASDARWIEVTAPRDAYRLMFESILETHRLAPGNIGTTTVRVAAEPDSGWSISIKTVLPGTMRLADLEKIWYQDAQAVAAKLGISVRRNLVLESNTIITRIVIPTEEESRS